MRKKIWSKQEQIDKRLDKISDIWNHYIWEYRFCQRRIKFTPDVKSNYFGDIISYFSDTLHLLFKKKKKTTLSGHIESAISFLQIIYVQQDFIEELLHIFKCQSTKAELKKADNYTINRQLRNELIGHPIRKDDINGKRQLISSTIFSNSINADEIAYIRYHLQNKYKFEEIKHKKAEILGRHTDFLLTYLEEIIAKLKEILLEFKKKIEELEIVIQKADFKEVIRFIGICFENIFKNDYLYKNDLLLSVYQLKDKHPRYQNGIDLFLGELSQAITDRKNDINELINDRDRFSRHSRPLDFYPKVSVLIEYVDSSPNAAPKDLRISYAYEMGKLVSKNDINNWMFFMSLMRSKVEGNTAVLAELDHMEQNIENDLEYYCAYHYVRKLLDID
jgi:hypothetical protein